MEFHSNRKSSAPVVSPLMAQSLGNQQMVAGGMQDSTAMVEANYKQLVLNAVAERVRKNKVMAQYEHSYTPLELDPENSTGVIVVSLLYGKHMFYAPYIIKDNKISDFDCLISSDGNIIIPVDEQWLKIVAKILGADDPGWVSELASGRRAFNRVIDAASDIEIGLGRGGESVLAAGANTFSKLSSEKKGKVKDFVRNLAKYSSSDRVQTFLKLFVDSVRKNSVEMKPIYVDSTFNVDMVKEIYAEYNNSCAILGTTPEFTLEDMLSSISEKGFFFFNGNIESSVEMVDVYQEFIKRFGGLVNYSSKTVIKDVIPKAEAGIVNLFREKVVEGKLDIVVSPSMYIRNYKSINYFSDKETGVLVQAPEVVGSPLRAIPSVKEALPETSGPAFSLEEIKALSHTRGTNFLTEDPRFSWLAEKDGMVSRLKVGDVVTIFERNMNGDYNSAIIGLRSAVIGTIKAIHVDETEMQGYLFGILITIAEKDTGKEVMVAFREGYGPESDAERKLIEMNFAATVIAVYRSLETELRPTTNLIASSEELLKFFTDLNRARLVKVSWNIDADKIGLQKAGKFSPTEVFTLNEFIYGAQKEDSYLDLKKISADTFMSDKKSGVITYLIKDKAVNSKKRKSSFGEAPVGFYSGTADMVNAPVNTDDLSARVQETYVDAALVPWVNDLAVDSTDGELSEDFLEILRGIDSELLNSLTLLGRVVLRLFTNEDEIKDLIGEEAWDNLKTTGISMFTKLGKYGLSLLEFVATVDQ